MNVLILVVFSTTYSYNINITYNISIIDDFIKYFFLTLFTYTSTFQLCVFLKKFTK